MRLFIDTSSLFKKYVQDPGVTGFEDVLAAASEIAVSPTTWLEMNGAIERRLRERLLSPAEADSLRVEIKRDFLYFPSVLWNEKLQAKALDLVRQHALKTLDAIQLASGILSGADVFITSDQALFSASKKFFKLTHLL